jgi:hypothetical protein
LLNLDKRIETIYNIVPRRLYFPALQ